MPDLPGAYGDLLGRYFEVPRAPALVMLPARARAVAPASLPAPAAFATPFVATRITCLPDQLGMKQEIPPEDAFVVTLHLSRAAHHELWVRGRPSVVRGCAAGALSIVDLRDEVASYLGTPLDALHFCVPHAVAQATGRARVSGLACAPGLLDPVLGNLGAAVLALFDRPQPTGSVVRQHLALAICAHLVHRFGHEADTDTAGAGSRSGPQSVRHLPDPAPAPWPHLH